MNNCLLSEKASKPTVQSLLAYRARLLADLAACLLEAEGGNVSVFAGLRLIRNELRSLSDDIRSLEPEDEIARVAAGKVLDEVLPPKKEFYTLEEMMNELDNRWAQSHR